VEKKETKARKKTEKYGINLYLEERKGYEEFVKGIKKYEQVAIKLFRGEENYEKGFKLRK